MKSLIYGSAIKPQLCFTLMALIGLTFMILIPNTASATKIHIQTPGFSIGFHDKFHDRHYRKHHRKYHKYRGYGLRHNKHYYYPRSYYYDDYYYRPRSRYYDRRYYGSDRRPICPIAGFSTGYDEDRNCYRHKDHFHCD